MKLNSIFLLRNIFLKELINNILINMIDLDFRSIQEPVKVTQLNNIQ